MRECERGYPSDKVKTGEIDIYQGVRTYCQYDDAHNPVANDWEKLIDLINLHPYTLYHVMGVTMWVMPSNIGTGIGKTWITVELGEYDDSETTESIADKVQHAISVFAYYVETISEIGIVQVVQPAIEDEVDQTFFSGPLTNPDSNPIFAAFIYTTNADQPATWDVLVRVKYESWFYQKNFSANYIKDGIRIDEGWAGHEVEDSGANEIVNNY